EHQGADRGGGGRPGDVAVAVGVDAADGGDHLDDAVVGEVGAAEVLDGVDADVGFELAVHGEGGAGGIVAVDRGGVGQLQQRRGIDQHGAGRGQHVMIEHQGADRGGGGRPGDVAVAVGVDAADGGDHLDDAVVGEMGAAEILDGVDADV